MIEVDGALGEGGGAVLRVSVGLAQALGVPVKVFNIRSNRPNPGLRPQHLSGLKACAKLTGGKVSGACEGSSEIEYSPGGKLEKRITVSVGTAGSATLVLQTLMIPLSFCRKKSVVEVSGGTDVKWSPPADYLKNVAIPVLAKFGLSAGLSIERRGYYPKGGGRLKLTAEPTGKLRPVELGFRGKVLRVCGVSHAHNSLSKARVSERCAKAARKTLSNALIREGFNNVSVGIELEYCDTPSPGAGIILWAECENSVLGADCLGDKGVRAEDVGVKAAQALVMEISHKRPLDTYMTDQIIPYLALLGGKIKVRNLSKHAETNIQVAEKFGAKIKRGKDEIAADPLFPS
ncbi:MAG: RNA 3'-terminal phosphate cyclase [Methanobacteriota archaeon]